MRFNQIRGRAAGFTIALAVAIPLSSCDTIKNNLLSATDPSTIDPSSVQSAAGATAVYNGALGRLRTATADGESSWMFGGLLADEWGSSSTFVQNDETDQRNTQLNNATVQGQVRALYRVITDANQAIPLLEKFKPNAAADTSGGAASHPSSVAEMYFIRGFAQLQLASDFCNGIPLSNGAGAVAVFGDPQPVSVVFQTAIASFDSAKTFSANAADPPSVAINNAARIGKARALVGLGKTNLPAAAAEVAAIPTTYRYDVTASLTGGTNTLWDQAASSARYTVGDSAQPNVRTALIGNAIPFGSTHDRRVPARYQIAKNGKDSVKSQDGGTYSVIVDSLWGQTSAVAVVHGLDARLIEAENFLNQGDITNWLATLNALRSAQIQITAPSPTSTGTHPGWIVPVMPALTDPGAGSGTLDPTSPRLKLFFREKAYWQFGRGIRLGDLRRQIRDYGFAPDGSQNFPTGAHYKGGSYGTDVNLPITTDEQVGNPKFSLCLDRKA
jgi:hypothetical protein